MFLGTDVQCPIFSPDFNLICVFLRDFSQKSANSKLHVNLSSGNSADICGQTDRQEDMTAMRMHHKTLSG
jgi:hypothetical protein